MSETLILSRAPIVEAVLDIDCDMPPGWNLAALEAPAREAFRDPYAKFRLQLIDEHQIEDRGDGPPTVSGRRGILALQFLQEDQKQVVQVRAQGFSFNRLTPYSTLDDYLPEIQRTWHLFVNLASPIQIRVVRLRYINRILLPLTEGHIRLSSYLRMSPEVPPEAGLVFAGCLNQQRAVDEATGDEVSIVLASQLLEKDALPVILDISAANRAGAAKPDDWGPILSRITVLRALKNRVFRSILTDECLKLFQ